MTSFFEEVANICGVHYHENYFFVEVTVVCFVINFPWTFNTRLITNESERRM